MGMKRTFFARRLSAFAAACAFAMILGSCVGVSGAVTFAQDGSGTASFSYTVSKTVESLGKLDANSPKLPFPVSRADFDLAVARTPGLRLDKWNRKDGQDDIVIDVAIAFDSPATLARFLDPEGKRATFVQEGKERRLSLVLATGTNALDADLAEFVDLVFEGYRFDLSVRTPTKVISAQPGTTESGGLVARYQAPMNEILKSSQEIKWTIRW